MIALFKKELFSLFCSPMIYIISGCFSLLNGYVFCILLSFLANPYGQVFTDVFHLYFGGTFFFWIAQLPLFTFLTMGLISEEKKSGAIELLITAPIKEQSIIFAKFLSVLVFYLFLWIPSFVYVLFVLPCSGFPWSVFCLSFIFILLLGSVFLSLGLAVSSFINTSFLSAIAFFSMSMGILFLGFFDTFRQYSVIAVLLDSFWPVAIGQNLTQGFLLSKQIIFMISFSFLNLYISWKILRNRQWTV